MKKKEEKKEHKKHEMKEVKMASGMKMPKKSKKK